MRICFLNLAQMQNSSLITISIQTLTRCRRVTPSSVRGKEHVRKSAWEATMYIACLRNCCSPSFHESHVVLNRSRKVRNSFLNTLVKIIWVVKTFQLFPVHLTYDKVYCIWVSLTVSLSYHHFIIIVSGVIYLSKECAIVCPANS